MRQQAEQYSLKNKLAPSTPFHLNLSSIRLIHSRWLKNMSLPYLIRKAMAVSLVSPSCRYSPRFLTFVFLLQVCCDYGDGYAAIYLEEISIDRILLLLDGNFHYRQQGNFLASTDGILNDVAPAIPTSSPSTSPSIGVPSASPFPTAAHVLLSIVVITDVYPGKFVLLHLSSQQKYR